MSKINYEALRIAIEKGSAQAAHDAGIERVAIQVNIVTLSVAGEPLPGIKIEVTELSEGAAAMIIEAGRAVEGN